MIPLVLLVDDVGGRLLARLGWELELTTLKEKWGRLFKLQRQTSSIRMNSSLFLQEHILKPCDGCLSLESLLSPVNCFYEPDNPRMMPILGRAQIS